MVVQYIFAPEYCLTQIPRFKKEYPMDTIKFIIEDYVDEENGFRFPTINIYINDVNLIQFVEQVEHRNRSLGGEEPLRPDYIGLEPEFHRSFRDEFLGVQARPLSLLLTCTCTIELCNCILAKVSMDADTVTWSNLHSPWLGGKTPSPWLDEEEAQALGWSPCDYSALGPFVFSREQYLKALDELNTSR